jgi:hypothetical protein
MKKGLTTFFALVFLITTAAPSAFSQELPEALKMSFDKGMAAAGQNEWDLAIKYFSEVEKGQPFYFPVYFNLALAHSKAGHELAAMAWFRAYLLSVPKAPEKTQIEKELTSLEVANEAKIRKLLKQAVDLSQALPAEGPNYAAPRATAIGSVYDAYAGAGMIEEAVALIPLIGAGGFRDEKYARRSYALTFVYEEDFETAEKLTAALPADSKFSVYGALLGKYPYSFKDASKAIRYAQEMTDTSQDYTLVYFIASLGENGRAEDAVALLEKFAAKNMKLEAAAKLAKSVAGKGDVTSAKKILAIAMPLYEEHKLTVPQDAYSISKLIDLALNLSSVMVSAGETAQARALADSFDLSKLDASSGWSRCHLVEMYIEIGDLSKAESIVSMMYNDTDAVPYAKRYLFDAFIKKGDAQKAGSMIGGLQENGFDPTLFPRSYANLAWLKLKAGDRSGFDSTFAAMPKRQSWDKTDSDTNQEQFYVELCSLANEAGDLENFKAFYAKIKDIYFKAQVKRLVAYRLKEKMKIDEAEEVLLGDESIWAKDHTYMVFDALGYDLADARLAKNDKAGAAALLDKMTTLADKFERFDQYENLVKYYEKAGQAGKAAGLRPKATDFKRTQLAKSFEADTELMDPDGYLKKIQSEKPEEIPAKMSAFASKLASGLRKIERMKSIK